MACRFIERLGTPPGAAPPVVRPFQPTVRIAVGVEIAIEPLMKTDPVVIDEVRTIVEAALAGDIAEMIAEHELVGGAAGFIGLEPVLLGRMN